MIIEELDLTLFMSQNIMKQNKMKQNNMKKNRNQQDLKY